MNSDTSNFDSSPADYSEEWLSAYLDDELTTEQRQIVEAKLASDPQTVQTLAELERVRGLVQQLPGWGHAHLDLSPSALAAAGVNVNKEAEDEWPDESSDLGVSELPDADRSHPARMLASRSEDVSSVWLKNQRSSSASNAWLRPLAVAASILFMLGLGYLLLPKMPKEVSLSSRHVDSAADSASATAAQQKSAQDSAGSAGPQPEEEWLVDSDELPADLALPSSGQGLLPAERTDHFEHQLPNQPIPLAAPVELELAPASAMPSLSNGASPSAGRAVAEEDFASRERQQAAPAQPEADSARREGGLAYDNTRGARSALPSIEGQRMQLEQALDVKTTTNAADPGNNAKPRVVFYGRNANWDEALLAQELQTNTALNSVLRRSLSGSTQPRMDSPPNPSAKLPAPIVVARIPSEQDAAKLFNQLVDANGLQVFDHVGDDGLAQPTAAQRLAAGAPAAGSQAAGTLQYSIPAEMQQESRAANDSQLIVLFLNRSQVEQVLQTLTVPNEPDGNGSLTKQNYLWIKPVTDSSADAPPEAQPAILLLNSDDG